MTSLFVYVLHIYFYGNGKLKIKMMFLQLSFRMGDTDSASSNDYKSSWEDRMWEAYEFPNKGMYNVSIHNK